MTPALIVGGGISGLSAAYYLAQRGISSTIVESAPRLGGVVTTDRVHGCVIEGGPDSFLTAKPAAAQLVRELGLGSGLIGSNDESRVTYIVRGGRLLPMPDGLMMMVPTKVMPMLGSPILSWGAKMRMARDWFRRPYEGAGKDRPVEEFIRDHYGQETVDYLAEPLLSGVYGGDPANLGTAAVLPRFLEIERTHGSLSRGLLAARAKQPAGESGPLFQTLTAGLGAIIEALEEKVRSSVTVVRGQAEALEPNDGGFRLRCNGEWIEARQVVLACPAWAAGRILAQHDADLAALLGSIDYSSSMTVALGYQRKAVNHPLRGFGFLVPKRERKRLVACTWVGQKFKHRVPETQAVLRCFLGGASDAAILDETDEAVTRIVRDEIARLMGVNAEPDFVRIHRWPRSMAQYGVGHAELVRRIGEQAARTPGLHLIGNAYQGIGLPDCIRMGGDVAQKIAQSAGS